MRKHMNFLCRRSAFVVAACAFGMIAQPALAIDWDNIQGADMTLFYPGQASWEWVLTGSSHSGATKFRQGRNCRGCHQGEEADMGNLIVSGKKLEPDPIPNKRGFIPLNVKAAHDGDRLYIRLQWSEQAQDGIPVMDKDWESRVTMMFDDGSVIEATRAACWGACHDDAHQMASDPGDVDIKKYLARSRVKITRHGGGMDMKPEADLAEMRDKGIFLEYWQARLNQGSPAVAHRGHILETREDAVTDDVTAEAEYSEGQWTVVLSGPLAGTGPYSKTFEPGKTYHVGFAIHDAHADRRFHHVSFEHTLVLDQGEADIVAVAAQ